MPSSWSSDTGSFVPCALTIYLVAFVRLLEVLEDDKEEGDEDGDDCLVLVSLLRVVLEDLLGICFDFDFA